MKLEKCSKESFVVIGKEGSSKDGHGFVKKLWEDANSHFNEVVGIAKKDKNGRVLGIWGAMSNFSRTFLPWQDNFSQGLYLAGVECKEDAPVPKGWTKWVIPGYEYVYVENQGEDLIVKVLDCLKQENLTLVGAIQDFSCPETQKNYLFFPIRKL